MEPKRTAARAPPGVTLKEGADAKTNTKTHMRTFVYRASKCRVCVCVCVNKVQQYSSYERVACQSKFILNRWVTDRWQQQCKNGVVVVELWKRFRLEPRRCTYYYGKLRVHPALLPYDQYHRRFSRALTSTAAGGWMRSTRSLTHTSRAKVKLGGRGGGPASKVQKEPT